MISLWVRQIMHIQLFFPMRSRVLCSFFQSGLALYLVLINRTWQKFSLLFLEIFLKDPMVCVFTFQQSKQPCDEDYCLIVQNSMETEKLIHHPLTAHCRCITRSVHHNRDPRWRILPNISIFNKSTSVHQLLALSQNWEALGCCLKLLLCFKLVNNTTRDGWTSEHQGKYANTNKMSTDSCIIRLLQKVIPGESLFLGDENE